MHAIRAATAPFCVMPQGQRRQKVQIGHHPIASIAYQCGKKLLLIIPASQHLHQMPFNIGGPSLPACAITAIDLNAEILRKGDEFKIVSCLDINMGQFKSLGLLDSPSQGPAGSVDGAAQVLIVIRKIKSR